jgi:uncharacterized protein (DUF2267 family)
MNELVTLVAQRTGMSQEDAQKAVATVLDFLKQKLPPPIASHIDSFLAGGMSSLGAEAGGLLKGAVGEIFGGTK